jgi:hypothetical protein
MVAVLSEGRHPGLYLRELGMCAVCSMSTSTTREGKGEPCEDGAAEAVLDNEQAREVARNFTWAVLGGFRGWQFFITGRCY